MQGDRSSQFATATPGFERAGTDWMPAYDDTAAGRITGYAPFIVPSGKGAKYHVNVEITIALDVDTQPDVIWARLVMGDANAPMGMLRPVGPMAAVWSDCKGTLASLTLEGNVEITDELPAKAAKWAVEVRTEAGTLLVSQTDAMNRGTVSYLLSEQ